jgi:hypothetical protein
MTGRTIHSKPVNCATGSGASPFVAAGQTIAYGQNYDSTVSAITVSTSGLATVCGRAAHASIQGPSSPGPRN